MTEIETRKLLLQLTQMLRAHFEYLHTLHDSTIALFDVLRKKNPEIETLYGNIHWCDHSILPGRPLRKCCAVLMG
jgi:hypothetical protein